MRVKTIYPCFSHYPEQDKLTEPPFRGPSFYPSAYNASNYLIKSLQYFGSF